MAIIPTALAYNYDFSVVVQSGQTLYFYRLSSNTVAVASENTDYPYYTTYPTGDLVIPATVTYNDVTYNVTTIGRNAFQGCSGLTTITIPNNVTTIGTWAFQDCTGLTSVTIPNSVTTIGRNAFQDCTGLTSVTIPNSVTSIGDDAFWGCRGLTSVTIPDGVTSIGENVFYGCSSLTSVTIPDGVTSIGHYAFANCSGLTSITIYAENPPTLGDNVFNGVRSNINVNVPCGKQMLYYARWTHFSNFIEMCNSGIDDADNINAEIYQRNGKVVVDGAEGNTVSFYDITGRILATKQDYGTPLRFDAPASGTYMIKIGNYQARKVVVIR